VLQTLRQGKSSAVSVDRRLRWIRAIAEGVSSLHSEGVTHRDLKPANVIVMSGAGFEVGGEAFLTDFGSARVVETMGRARASADAGTLQYTPPEVLRDEPRDYTRVDVYALSVMSWEVLSGKAPFGSAPEAAVREMVKSGDRPAVREGWPDGAVAAIVRGWETSSSIEYCNLGMRAPAKAKNCPHKSSLRLVCHNLTSPPHPPRPRSSAQLPPPLPLTSLYPHP
jgi:serine/threonine protein kinase